MGIAGPAPSGAPICFKNYIIMTVRKLFPVLNPTLEFKIPKLSLVVDIEITLKQHSFKYKFPEISHFFKLFWSSTSVTELLLQKLMNLLRNSKTLKQLLHFFKCKFPEISHFFKLFWSSCKCHVM